MPKSLLAAEDDQIRLFIAEETLEEVFRKIPEFTSDLGTTTADLELALAEQWTSLMRVVPMPPGASVGPRTLAVAGRDPTDRAAAALMALLAPCLLFTSDNDFKAFGVLRPGEPMIGIRAAGDLTPSAVGAAAQIVLPTLPAVGAVQLIRWVGRQAKMSDWLLLGVVAGGTAILYHRLGPERQAGFRLVAGEVLADLGRMHITGLEEFHAHERVLYEHVVMPALPVGAETLVLRRLARADKPLSVQRLWEQLEPGERPSVAGIRTILRDHPACCLAGRGVYTLGAVLGDAA